MNRDFHTCLLAGALCLASHLAIGQVSTAEPAELRSAKSTYHQQVKAATDPIKTRYAAYLETLKKALEAKKDQNGVQAVQAELDSLGLPSAAVPVAAPGSARLVIWNTNNGGKGDRGATRVNIVLSADGKETWHLNGVPLKWEADGETKKEFEIPAVRVDKIRVEVTGLKNERGGLAEIEFIKDGKNLAKHRPVEVSAVWENNKEREGSMLTDGDPVSAWLLPDKKTGWAEISLESSVR